MGVSGVVKSDHLDASPTGGCLSFSPSWSPDAPGLILMAGGYHPLSVSRLRLTAPIVWNYSQTQRGTPSRCLYLATLAVERQ